MLGSQFVRSGLSGHSKMLLGMTMVEIEFKNENEEIFWLMQAN